MTVFYRVNDIYPCIQGEGCQTGVAMVLLRLHGCAVGCPWCDTKETWIVEESQRVESINEALGTNARWISMSAGEIASYIPEHHPGPRWVLVTGGEPAEQDLKPLVNALHSAGYKVALETSGTALGHVNVRFDWICVSPKIGMPGGKQVLPEAVESADEIKYVVCTQKDINQLDTLLAEFNLHGAEICLQPVSTSPKATQLCIDTVQRRGWRLSIQVHKYIRQR
jgi:7-carboxy-7-deazaguanine synthase